MKIKYLYIISFLFLYSNLLFSQEEFHPGSPYTAFGIGDLQYSSSLRTDAMGIQGIALKGNYINNFNPASNSDISLTNISLSFKYGITKLDNGIMKANFNDGNVNGVNLGIPLSQQRGWVFVAGFNTLSQSNFKISNIVNTPDISYTQTYAGIGGVSRLNFGMSYNLISGVSLGAEYNYAFGNLKTLTLLDFNNVYYSNSYIRKENNLTGSYFKGGLIFDFGKFIKNKNFSDFTLGFLYQSKLSLASSIDAIYGSSLANDTTNNVSSLEVPQAFGFGFSKKFGKQLIISGDALIQQWGNFVPSNQTTVYFKNSERFGLGFEILPSVNTEKTFFESLTYRFGGFYDMLYYNLNGQDINRFGISAGLNIPVNKQNSIDIGISYSSRGTTDYKLIKDQYIKLSVALNFGELWFVRPKDEDR